DEVAEGALAEVVDEGVVGAEDAVAGAARAEGIVVVLEEAQDKALVQRANATVRVGAYGEAEHGGGGKVESLAAARFIVRRGEVGLGGGGGGVGRGGGGGVWGFGFGLVPGGVGGGANKARGGVEGVRQQPPIPLRRDDRVVVEQDESLAASLGETMVVCGGEA